jgi:methylated-DNA-[protein]-cysteine S-methyltransferase
MQLEHGEISSPIGTIHVVVLDGALCGLGFAEAWPELRARLERRFGRCVFQRAADPGGVVSPLKDYLEGDLDAAAKLRVDPGGTPFQRRVWSMLRSVPAGGTTSYRALADEVGCPKAARAVGSANAANPIAVVIPCHRVIRTDGDLGGYAYGLERKRWLLHHEGALR